MKDFQFVSIATMSRAGSGFLSYLLASHEEVMTLPDIFSSDLHLLNISSFFSKTTQSEAIDTYIVNHKIIFDPKSDFDRSIRFGWLNMGLDHNSSFSVDQEYFKITLIKLLSQYSISREKLYYAIHAAYYIASGRDISKKTIIVLGTHMLLNAINIYHKELNNHSIIYCVRDPVASIFSSIHHQEQVYDRLFYDTYFSLVSYSLKCQSLLAFYKRHVYIVKLEDLHMNPNDTLQGLLSTLKLSGEAKILKAEVNGLEWHGESWSGSLNSGTFDINRLNKRNDAVKAKFSSDLDKLKNTLFYDCYYLYPEIYSDLTFKSINSRSNLLNILFQAIPLRQIEINLFLHDLMGTDLTLSRRISLLIINILKIISLRHYQYKFIKALLSNNDKAPNINSLSVDLIDVLRSIAKR
jgi:hypothetical protein